METKKVDRRTFITWAAVVGVTSAFGRSIYTRASVRPQQEQLTILIHLSKQVNFKDYVQIRNRKMNFSWYTDVEKEFQAQKKILSSNFSFSGNQAKVDYIFADKASKQQFITLLNQKYGVVASKLRNNELVLDFSEAA